MLDVRSVVAEVRSGYERTSILLQQIRDLLLVHVDIHANDSEQSHEDARTTIDRINGEIMAEQELDQIGHE